MINDIILLEYGIYTISEIWLSSPKKSTLQAITRRIRGWKNIVKDVEKSITSLFWVSVSCIERIKSEHEPRMTCRLPTHRTNKDLD